MSSGKASIVLLTYNNLRYTRECLESIYAKTEPADFEVIVVDNASQDETPQYLEAFGREHPNFSFILNAANEGFARGNNIGATAAKGEYLVFLNNDTLVTRGWLEGLLRPLEDSSVGMVGPVTNGSSNETRVLHTYTDIGGLDAFAEEYARSHRGQSFEIRTLAFMCVALRRRVFEEIGPLDERFGLGMFEDDDYAMRLREKGYKLLCIEDVYIHHWGGGSFLKMAPLAYWQLFRENRAKFEEKWNTTWQPHLNRPELLPNQVIQLTEWGYNLQWDLLHHQQLVERLRLQVDDLAQERERYLAYTEGLAQQLNERNLQVIERDQQLAERDQQITERDQQIADRNQQILNCNQQIAFLNQQIIARNRDIDEIHSSKAWKLIQKLWYYRVRLLPHNSWGERLLFRLTGRRHLAVVPASQPATPAMPSPAQAVSGLPAPRLPLPPGSEVAILAPQFFDFKGETVYLGGAERYLVELAHLIQEMGHRPVVYQGAQGEWQREFEGLPVVGLDSGGDARRLNARFHTLVSPETPVIYLVFDLAFPRCHPHSVGISHGVYWDQTEQLSPEQRQQRFLEILEPMTKLSQLVSVDTNTVNWVRTVRHPLSEKFTYIPNFVDTEKFHPAEHKSGDKLVVLYPRRLYAPRGFWLVHEIIPEFLDRYPEIEFHFVGQANPPEEKAVTELVGRYPGRVQWKALPLDQMHLAYQQADITLIPTLGKEGTSLSCLEAMSCGNAVIATNVGGLSDLIFPGYNGLLIEPNALALKEALHLLCQDQSLRSSLSQRSRLVAETFSIAPWYARWKRLLREQLLFA